MIFLYRDGRCKILDPEMPSDKVGRKVMKRKEEIMAVLVDCSTRLRSDTYVLVSAEHFLTKPPIRKVAFTAAFLREDESPHEGNVLHREVDIDNLYDLYGAASTIYQIRCSPSRRRWFSSMSPSRIDRERSIAMTWRLLDPIGKDAVTSCRSTA